MMKAIKKETRQSSSTHQKISNAAFVPIEPNNTKKFKYNLKLSGSKYINKKLLTLKTLKNKIIQKPQLWLHKVDFKEMIKDSSVWFVEAAIEGAIINFIVWALMGWRFNWITFLAWGFVVKQLLSIYWRLRNNGADSKILKNNK